MKTKKGRKIMSLVMAFLMVVGIMPMDWTARAVYAADTVNYVFDASTETAITSAEKKAAIAAGKYGTSNYYTLSGNVIRANSNTLSAELGLKSDSADFGTLSFTVTGTADVKVVSQSTGGTNVSEMCLYNSKGDKMGAGTVIVTGTASNTETTYKGLTADTYTLQVPTDYDETAHKRGVRILSVTTAQTASGERDPRAEWSKVAAPVIGDITTEGGKVTVPFTMTVGYDGADSVVVTMKDAKGEVAATQTYAKDSTEGSVVFSPKASGNYTFSIVAKREGEEDKAGADKTLEGYALPLATPSFSSATSKGNGSISLVWNEVTEADDYLISYSEDGVTYSEAVKVTDTEYVVTGLTVGKKYTFKLVAERTNPKATSEAAAIEGTATADEQMLWSFSAFGQGVVSDSKSCGYEGNANDGSVTVWDLNSKGKLVPASTDGLSFYYATVPADKNFTLSATVKVDQWTYTNGQEGFGLMAADRVGINGDASVFWNNSYMASATKTEYYVDAQGNVTDDSTASKVTMKLGVGSQEKKGVTKADLANDPTKIPDKFSTKMTTLDTSCAKKGFGTYNILGNYTNADSTFLGTVVENPVTELKLQIQKNNTGYFVSYTDADGKTVTKKYYDTDALQKLDEDNVYVGFYASRTFKMTASDIKLTIVDPKDDAPAEERPVTYVTPNYQILSSTAANNEAYTLKYKGNADGHLVITDKDDNKIADTDVKAGTKYTFDTKLALGNNDYKVEMTPDADYQPSEFEKLSSYDKVTFTHTVSYEKFDTDDIYVTPDASATGKGTKDSPVSIYTAVNYAQPGQNIILAGGTYNLKSTLTIQPGVNGTEDKNITMKAEDSSNRPVLDFGKNCEGLVLAGSYWTCKDFDVTNSANGKDGIRLSGSHCTMDNLQMYKNGNTGLQISRYMSTDTKEDWPSYNHVLNCTSHNNADAGYEDADGFAAKLTIGDGNVFEGCIAHNNADDGWDLFAKAETGPIGSVTIKNSVAYANGYLEDGTDAGNGNGFKMGGSSITGYHKLINSVAFDNKSKGIDSNSCPDIQVSSNTTFNNEGSNIALYTNDAANTDFSASGILSYRTQHTDVNETFKLKGTQDTSKVYQANDYYWNYDGETAHKSNDIINDTFFKSVDTKMDYTTHVYSSEPVTRNEDNSINMNGLLVLTDEAKTALGDGVGGDVNKEVVEPVKPEALKTIWKTQEVGSHTTEGSYAYDDKTCTVTVTGAGSKFDKDNGNDDLYYAYFQSKGEVTVSAKMKVTGKGQAGILVKNSADEANSAAASVYADLSKSQVIYAYHGTEAGGGASNLNANVTTASEDIYVKLVVSNGTAKFYVATKADFSDAVEKAQSINDIDAKTVGFFATEGATAEFSDIKVTSKYDVDGVTNNKVIFDSATGELIPEFTSSKEYSGNYDAGNSFNTSVDGNVLTVEHKRSATVKGNIRDDKGVDYWLFPATSEDRTITADITIKSLDTGTDKQGIAIGQFNAKTGSAMKCDIMHFQKNKVAQHTYSTTAGTGNGGDPKTSIATDVTYTISYAKKGSEVYVTLKDATGATLIDNQVIDLVNDYEDLLAGKEVRYGFAFTGVVADISNVYIKDTEGTILYDMNDYYVAVGVAPEIANAKAVVAEDRRSIDLSWDITKEGSGNVKYSVYVKKDDGEYTKVGDSKVNSFKFAGMTGDGSYTFKIVPAGGDSQGIAIETAAVTYQTPLTSVTLDAKASSKDVVLTWNASEGAESYDVYRKLGSDGTYAVVKNTTELTYTDTDVTAEEPYYYYVIAKNSKNVSNPSDTMQVLTSDGHKGQYVYEKDATVVTVTDKSNDTIFADNASMKLNTNEDVTVKVNINGTLTDTKEVKADTETAFEFKKLKQGRNTVELLFTDKDGNTTRKVYNFVSNPKIDMVVDASFDGENGTVKDGYPTYKTVQSAVETVAADNAASKVIFVKNGTYKERVTVTAPFVSILGEDAVKTNIGYAVCVANGNATSMWDRNAMYVDTAATGFTAENITIENTYNYTNGNDQQADALCIVADETLCVNVRIVGYQDSLLTDTRVKGADGNYLVTRQYFDKCYITGNVDFIYGAGTSVFNDCDIVARYTQYKADGVYTAGRTYAATKYGYTFINCSFTAEDGVADGAYRMARPWGKDDSTVFINCYLGRAINPNGAYGDMSGNSFKNARFAEYGSYGPGYVVNNDRPLLSSKQAAEYTTANIMGDYDVEKVMNSLYKSEVAKEDLTVKATADKTDVTVGNKVTFKAEANGGSEGYTYKFIIHNTDTDQWAKLQDFSANNTLTWTAGKAGNREIFVDVKDVTGKVVRSSVIKVKVAAKAEALSIKATADKTTTAAGDKVTVKAAANGGSGKYTYKFIIHNLDTNEWFKLKDFSADNTFIWTAGKVGNREIFVDVKDATGKVVRCSAIKIKTTAKSNVFAVNATASKTNTVVNDKITFKAEATGGSGVYAYKFIVHNTVTNKWYKLQDFGTNSTLTWTAGSVGNREFFIDAKDATGKVVRSKAITVITAKKDLAVTAGVNKTTAVKGDKVVISSSANGGNGKYTYSYLVHNKTTNKWARLQGFGSNSTLTWTAGGTGDREFFVEVKDATGKVVRSAAANVVVK